jgi:hypothetical protein
LRATIESFARPNLDPVGNGHDALALRVSAQVTERGKVGSTRRSLAMPLGLRGVREVITRTISDRASVWASKNRDK